MRRTAGLLKRVAARWQLRAPRPSRAEFSEQGDTLVEVLLAMVVLGIAALALLVGFATSITASAEHRNLASLDSSTRIAANEAIADVQQEAANAANNPFVCSNTFTPTFSNLTGSFTVTYTVAYWNGTSFGPTCTNYAPQQYTLTISSGGYSTVVTTVVYDPSAPPSPNGVGQPAQLVWLQQPTGGTVGTPVTPQPEVAVEDALNNIVTSDLSSVTLQIISGPAGGSFSNTCSGVESYGIVQFSDCSLNVVGTYVVKAVDSNSSVTPTTTVANPPATIVVTGAPAAQLAFVPPAVPGTASNTANVGLITVQLQDAFNNPINATTAVTVNLTSSSTGTYIFNTTQNATGPTGPSSVTIPAGKNSVSFYYGDTLAGSPTITASAGGLASGTQVETIKPGPAATFSLSTPSPTAGQSFTETITALDAYGNTATSFTGTQCVAFTGAASSPSGKPPAYPAANGCATGSSLTFAAGVDNAVPITLYHAGSTTLKATSVPTPALTGSVTFTVSSAALATLTVANIGTPQTAGSAFTVNLTGADAYGNPFSGTVSPTFSGPAASPNGTNPSYPTSVTFTNGSAAPSVTLYDAQNTTLKVVSGAASVTSNTFTVNAGPFVGFTLSTPTPTAGTAFTENITAGDQWGNGSSGAGTQCITFSGPAPSPNGNTPTYPGAGTCASGSSVTFNANGLGTASINLFKSGTTTLTATSVANPATTGSVTFTVASGPLKTLTIPTTPGTQTAGLGFSVAIDATDTYGNPFGGTVTTAGNGLGFSGPSNSPLPSNTAPTYPTSLTFTNGAATASIKLYDAQSTTLTVGATGATSGTTPASFTVNPAGASLLYFSTQPGGAVTEGTAFTQPVLTAQDPYSNTANSFVSAVTLQVATYAAGGGGHTQGSITNCTANPVTAVGGVATFAGCAITGPAAAGNYTLKATGGGLTSSASNTVTVAAGGATQLLFSTQPGGSVAEGTAFTQPVLTAEDANGNTATGFTNAVTLHVAGYTAGGGGHTQGTIAGCTNPVTAIGGVATFTGCDITGPAAAGTYTFNATGGGLTSPTSTGSVTVTAGAVSQLLISTQPGGTVGEGVAFTQPVFTAEDANGNTVSGAAVTLNIKAYTAGGGGHTQGTIAGCTNPVNTSATGVATFTGCDITGPAAAGTYTFDATSGGATSATTNSVTITAGTTATQLVFSIQPVGGVGIGAAFATQPQLTAEDANGNTVTGYVTNVTLHIDTYTAGNGGFIAGALHCTTNPVTPINGVATFAGCDITGSANNAGTYSFDATSGGLTSAKSNNVTIT